MAEGQVRAWMCRRPGLKQAKANFSKKVCAMDSLKFLFGVVLFLLCMLVAGIVIWVMLFGIPKSAMDGGTLVNLFGQMNWRG